MRVEILESRQFDPYNQLLVIEVCEAKLFGLMDGEKKIMKVVGHVGSNWDVFPDMELVSPELKEEINTAIGKQQLDTI